jgi:small subunit ribosomal protein S6
MSLYECVFIARQDIAQPQVDALADQFAGVLSAGGGEVKKREYWGLRNISFRINKNRKGHYMLFNISAPHAAVKEMERQMGLNEDVLRYLTVRVEELEEGPSAVMQSRNQRDDRPRREGGFGRDGDDRPRREGGFGGGFGRDRDGGFGRGPRTEGDGGFSRPPRTEGGEA